MNHKLIAGVFVGVMILFVMIVSSSSFFALDRAKQQASEAQKQDKLITTENTFTGIDAISDDLPRFSTLEQLLNHYGCELKNFSACMDEVAEKNNYTGGYEQFIIQSLNNDPVENEEFLSAGEVVTSIFESNEIKKLQEIYPSIIEDSIIYTSREVKTLSNHRENSSWYDITDQIQDQYTTNESTEVWQVLMTCFAPQCATEKFASLPEDIVGPQPNGRKSGDLIFSVNAKTGELLFITRGRGIRGDALMFVTDWARYLK